jgi:hypothetical protein
VPLMASPAECGFPSPADDHLDRPLDFNELPIQNATFAVRIAGESMTGAGQNRAISPSDVKQVPLHLVERHFLGAAVTGAMLVAGTVQRIARRGAQRCHLGLRHIAYL